MNLLLSILLPLLALAIVVACTAQAPHGSGRLHALANVAEGFQPAKKTYFADAIISTRHLLGKIGSDSSHVDLCGVGDIPLGFITDEAAAIEDGVSVSLLGVQSEGSIGVASAAIAAGDLLVAAAAGKLRTLPVASGTYHIIGRAISAAAAADDLVELIPTFPVQRVVA